MKTRTDKINEFNEQAIELENEIWYLHRTNDYMYYVPLRGDESAGKHFYDRFCKMNNIDDLMSEIETNDKIYTKYRKFVKEYIEFMGSYREMLLETIEKDKERAKFRAME
jgi:hypothetical protein